MTSILTLFEGCGLIFNSVRLKYNETQCANPWTKHYAGPSERYDVVRDFLKTQDIRIYDLDIKSEGRGESCLACTCLSGDVVYLRTLEDDADIARSLEFHFL